MTDPNVLKVRNDNLFHFREKSAGSFESDDPDRPSWAEKTFKLQDLRAQIEPWLTSLVQSEHLAILVGSGLTHAVHGMAAGRLAAGMSQLSLTSPYAAAIDAAAKAAASRAEREAGNLEDQIRVANELLRGLEILGSRDGDEAEKKKDEAQELSHELDKAMEEFAKSILQSEAGIASAPDVSRGKAFTVLIDFLMSFASRTGTRDRLNIFTTNYDRLIETGAEIAGIHLLDRFVGTLAPFFRSSRLDLDIHYNPPGIRGEPRYLEGVARFTKLHGSVDWLATGGDIRRLGLPFGAEEVDAFLDAPGLKEASPHKLMIYPNAAKDRETAEYPYVELFRDLAAAICRPNSTLVTYGYSFGDEHINRVIRDMLTIPSTHLVIISYGDSPLGRIMKEYDRIGRNSQMSLMIGPIIGNLPTLTEHFLPKPAIDRTTFRMAELLKQRFGTETRTSDNAAGGGGAS